MSSRPADANETTPLLQDCEAQRVSPPTPVPVPKVQLGTLCVVRMADPIAYVQIFPYINEFIVFLGLTNDPSRTGFYSGLVESTFAIAQFLSIYGWARLSDRTGRVPVIAAGTMGVAITTILFGLSTSLEQMLTIRFLGGFFSGTVAVIHSALGEMAHSSNQAVCFAFYGFFWPVGSVFGALLGGTLSNPADMFPNYLDFPFLRQYPYFLPGLIGGAIAALGSCLAAFRLEETLPSKRRQSAEKASQRIPVEVPLSFSQLRTIPRIQNLALSACFLSYNAVAFDVTFVLFCFSPREAGGLGFSNDDIGYALALAGSFAAMVQIAIMPRLLRAFDSAAIYRFCSAFWPIASFCLPFLNLAATWGGHGGSQRPSLLLWVCVYGVLILSKIGAMCFCVVMILAKESAPTQASLGATNGLVQATMCFSRAFGPALISSVFAYSLEKSLLGGYFWVVFMVVCGAIGHLTTRPVKIT